MTLSAARVRSRIFSSVAVLVFSCSGVATAEDTPPATPADAQSAPPENTAVEPATPMPTPAVEAPALQATDTAVVEPSIPTTYGPTKKGDTLMAIAKQLGTDGAVTTEQWGWALYQANPKAFDKGDITRIRVGQTLAVPTLDIVLATSHDAAQAEIEKRLKESRNRPPAKPKDPVVVKLESELAETKRDSVETAKEQALLKRRLKEIEKEIQELLRANAERDAALRRQASNTK